MTCRRCLLAAMEAERPLFALMREWIDALPEENRTAPGAYRTRLAACQACDALVNGMCGLCGCYVELRAAKANQRCPGLPARWG